MSWTGRRTGSRTRWSILRPVLLCAAVLTGLGGCRGRSDLVEAELRTRDAEVRELRAALQRSETLNHAITHTYPGPPPGVVVGPPPFAPPAFAPAEGVAPSTAVMSGTVRTVELGRGTGGVDQDGLGGDEGLLVIVIPKDTDGSALKIPGNLVIQTYEFSAEGQKLPHNRWEIPALDLQKQWKAGLLSTGYSLTLPWKTLPRGDKLRVVAQFTVLADNRTFEAEKDVTVRLMQRAPLPPVIVPQMGLPRDVLPPPFDGPILAPSASLRDRDPAATLSAARPSSQTTTSAKPGTGDRPKLLEPQDPTDDR